MIENGLESGVYVRFCFCTSSCASLSIAESVWLLCVHVTLCVCVGARESCGVSEEFSVSEVSEPRLFDSTPLRLGEFPLQFPSAEPTLGKESHARKIYVDVSNENTTTPLPRLTIFVKQQCVHSFSLSLGSLLSP